VSNNSIRTYKLGNRDELIAAVYERYGKKLYSYAIRSWNVSEDVAWDLIYKTIYKVTDSYRKYSFESEEKFGSFVFRVFINFLRNHYRDHKQEKEFQFSAIDDIDISTKEAPAGNENTKNAKLAALNEELEKMEDWQRMLLLMRSEGMSYAEIARYVNKPENQLKVYYQRLKEQITKRLDERSRS
jgi:RNA polymerase sigma factor (sigma-70 family)